MKKDAMPDLGEKGWEPLGVAFRRVEAERDEACRQLANLRAAIEAERVKQFRRWWTEGGAEPTTLRRILADPACGGPE